MFVRLHQCWKLLLQPLVVIHNLELVPTVDGLFIVDGLVENLVVLILDVGTFALFEVIFATVILGVVGVQNLQIRHSLLLGPIVAHDASA